MVANPQDLFGGTSALLDLVGMIYASVQEPTLWPVILDRIAAASHGHQTYMFTATVDPAMPGALVGSRTDPAALEEFLACYGAINPFS